MPGRSGIRIRRRYAATRIIGSCVCCWLKTSPTWRRRSATGCGSRRSRPTSPATGTPPSSC
ncbi:hypothetical protein ACFPRL_04705 [Pseudoclavibacter helvolus]